MAYLAAEVSTQQERKRKEENENENENDGFAGREANGP